MLKALRNLVFGDKGHVKDPISQLMEEKNPQRDWDLGPSFKEIMAMRSNMRDIPVSNAQRGWKIRDALNAMGVLSWFPKPTQKGMVVFYKYGHDLGPEEIDAVLEKYGGVSPDIPSSVAEEPSDSQVTTVVKRSSEGSTTEPQKHQTVTVSMADVSKVESDLMKQGFVVIGHESLSVDGNVTIKYMDQKDSKVV